MPRARSALLRTLALTAAAAAVSAIAVTLPEGATATTDAPVLEITKSVQPDPLVIGGPAEYVVTVTNSGGSAAEDVQVTDELDPRLTPGTLPDECTADGSTVTCGGDGTTVGAGESVQYTIPVTVDPSLNDGDNITNRASVSTSTPGATTDSTQLITIAQTRTDVEVTKSGPESVEPGEEFEYTVVVTNQGPSDAVTVTVQDPTDGNQTSIVGLPEQCPPSGLTITCSLETLDPGESVSLTFTLVADEDLAEGTTIQNCATVYTGSRETDIDDNVSCVETSVGPDAPVDDVEVAKSGPATTTPGGQVTYTVTVTNDGEAPSDEIVLYDPIDVATIAPATLPEQCRRVGDTIVCTLDPLQPQESQTLEFVFDVEGEAGDHIHNCASLSLPTRARAIGARAACADTEIQGDDPDPSPTPTEPSPDPTPTGSPSPGPDPTPTGSPSPGPDPTPTDSPPPDYGGRPGDRLPVTGASLSALGAAALTLIGGGLAARRLAARRRSGTRG